MYDKIHYKLKKKKKEKKKKVCAWNKSIWKTKSPKKDCQTSPCRKSPISDNNM